MKKILPGILLVLLISFDVFGQALKSKKISEAGKQEAKREEPTLTETVEWLNEKFKSSIVAAFSYEKKCIHYFDLKTNSQEIIAIKRHNCDGINYEITYTLPFKALNSTDYEEKGKSPVAALTILLKCTGGNSCISKKYKDYTANTTKTTYVSSFDFYDINAKCTNMEIKERIINAINHAINLNGGGKLNEKF